MYQKTRLGSYLLWISLCLLSRPAMADQFHYQNFLAGDRSLGMGGAYAGVADDASSIYYNPAGAAFALSNDISGSANVIYKRDVVYKGAIAGQDFTEQSAGSVPSFFGGLIKLDNLMDGLSLSWGLYSLDSNLKDQDDYYENVSLGNYTCPNGSESKPLRLDRFHRTVNARESSDYIGAAASWRVSNRLAIGVGVNYITISELVQEYQDVKQTNYYCDTANVPQEAKFTLTQNTRQMLTAFGLQPTLGFQLAATDRFSIGLNLKFGSYLAQEFERRTETRTLKLLAADQAQIDASSQAVSLNPQIMDAYHSPGNELKLDKPLGSMPSVARLGFAYFASTRLLLTTDVEHVSAVTDADIGDSLYGREAVTNMMAGIEYYTTPSLPVRLGFFTNNDARPVIDKNKVNQRDRVDFTGASVFLAWVQPNSQIGAGVVLQSGQGEAQKISNSKAVQDVSGSAYSLAFSATTAL
ncbi:MAG: hypothetical protein OXT67_11175 [Zetaproteobacteria bacterium]|nr:hypothetical protein [Zetaproteobacteria bacterium]